MLASLPEKERQKAIADLDDRTKAYLLHDWNFWARPNQLPPAGSWQYWLILAGRGFGKTRTGAETVRQWVKHHSYVNLIGPTVDDARDIMVEGESGILAICPPDERPLYKKQERKLVWPNGNVSLVFTADEPERLRGKQHEKLWADELCAWRYPEAWDQAQFGLRLGENPQAVITTTPKPSPLLKALIENPACHVTRGSTYDNKSNLAPQFLDTIVRKYEGSRLGRQELYAEVLDDVPGALWSEASIDNNRVQTGSVPDMLRVVIGVDPSGADDESDTADEIGIVVVGLGDDGDTYVLEDLTLSGGPAKWGKVVADAYDRHQADRVVAETNFGGAMVESVIRAADPNISFKSVKASRGKAVRAEPVAALYEQGKVRHVGVFSRLEEQMRWFTTTGYKGEGSPDRVDALVWGITELFPRMTKKDKGKINNRKGLAPIGATSGGWMGM